MKKVIIVTPFLSGKGGTETVIKNVFRCMKENADYKLELYLLGGTEDSSWLEDVAVTTVKLKLPLKFKKIEYLFRLPFLLFNIIKQNPEYLISTSPVIWTLLFYLNRIFRKQAKILGWYHYSIYKKNISQLAIHSLDGFLAISSGIANEVAKLGLNREKIFIVFNPVFFESNDLINSPGKSNLFEFVYMGRYDYNQQKNVSELFTALGKLNVKFRLRIFGEGQDKARLDELAKSLKISSSIEWCGFKNDVWSNIKVADALILSSNYEGFPMVLLESLTHGLVIVSSNCPTGPNDIIQQGKNGYLYEPGNISELVYFLGNVRQCQYWGNQTNVIRSGSNYNPKKFEKRLVDALAAIGK